MKVIEISVLVLVPNDATDEGTRELVGTAISESLNNSMTLLDVSLLSSRTVSNQEAEELTA